MAFVFYHKFVWLTSRLRQAERGRQSAELDNRLFKQDFGDKINSLQLEVEALTRQRTQLELELKQEKEKRSQNKGTPGKGAQKPESRMVMCAHLLYSTHILGASLKGPSGLSQSTCFVAVVHSVQTAKHAAWMEEKVTLSSPLGFISSTCCILFWII